MPLDPSIYQNVGRVNLGQGLSDILDQQRQRDVMNEQRQLSLASLAMQQETAQQKANQERNQNLNMWLSNAVKSGRPIEDVLPEAIAKGKEIGVMPDVTQRHVTSVYGAATPQERSNVAVSQAYPKEFAEQQIKSMFPSQVSQAAPSNLGKLIQEREKLPPGHPMIKSYDEAIRKETALSSEKPVNWTPLQTETGIVQINPQTGQIRDLGVKAPPKPAGKGGAMTPEQLTQAEIKAQATLDQLEKLYKHPGRAAGTGASSFMSAIPATDAKGFAAELKTFQAKAFLDAVQAMKGLGALTEQEGAKMVASIGALDPSMKEEDFAANLQSVAQEMYDIAKAKGLNVKLPTFGARKSAGGATFLGFE